MLKENQLLLKKFIDKKRIDKNVSKNTILKYGNNFLRFEQMLLKPKTFDKIAQGDVDKAVLRAKDSGKWESSTIDTTAQVMNTFWSSLGLHLKMKRLRRRNGMYRLPEDLLTEEEVLKLIDNAEHARDKALIATLYESGIRAGELLAMKIKDFALDDLGAVIQVDGKTGQRRLRLVFAVSYLKNWLARHPLRNDRNSAMWVGIGNRSLHEPLGYDDMLVFLRKLGEKCEIKKPMNPHQFRHSRASFLAKFLTEAQLKVYFGWTQSSEMAATYVHLSGRDVDDALLSKVFGRKKIEENGVTKLLDKFCLRCKEINTAEQSLCQRCGFPLEAGAAEDYEKRLKHKQLEYEEIMTKLERMERLVLPQIKNKR